MKLLLGLLLLVTAAPAAAHLRLRWEPKRPGDGKPFLLVVEGLSPKARAWGRFLGKRFAFRYDTGAKAHVAVASVPMGKRPRRYPVRVWARSAGLGVTLSAQVKTRWVRYPRSVVHIKPQKGAVRRGERAVSGGKLIRKALERWTRKVHWRLPFHRPLSTRVTEHFGVRRLYKKMRGKRVVRRWRGRHWGLDLDGNGGEPIGAVTDGVVALTGHFHGTGKAVFVDHGYGFFTAYYHMSKILVKQGQRVKRAQLLGKVGATGRVSGPHLHLAVILGGKRVDPEALLALKP